MGDPEEQSLLVLIQRAVAKRRDVYIRLRSGGQLVVLGEERLFQQSGCGLSDLVGATPSNTTVKSLSARSPTVAGVRERGRELGELQWIIAYGISEGRLLFDARDTDVFRMERWPNFTRLPHTDHCLRMTALLAKRATSVALTSKILGIPIEQVRQFYSAAREAGYAAAVGQKAEVIDFPESKRRPSLISSLLTKLKRASSGEP